MGRQGDGDPLSLVELVTFSHPEEKKKSTIKKAKEVLEKVTPKKKGKEAKKEKEKDKGKEKEKKERRLRRKKKKLQKRRRKKVIDNFLNYSIQKRDYSFCSPFFIGKTHLILQDPVAASTIAWTFSNFAFIGMSHPEWRIKPSGPISLISLML